jgi:hypothetical protein
LGRFRIWEGSIPCLLPKLLPHYPGNAATSTNMHEQLINKSGTTATELDARDQERCCCMSQYVRTVATTYIECDLATAFRGASSTEGLPAIFPGKGPIPGVVSAWIQGGGRQEVGAVRVCATNDGNQVEERYIEWSPPNAYAYEMTKLKAPLSLMLRKATGTWQFTPEGNGTRVVWWYYGEWTNLAMYPFTALIVKVFLRGAMEDCLARLKASIERPGPFPVLPYKAVKA